MGSLDAIAARVPPDVHEGMVRAFDHHGEYVGCIGKQTWRWLLDHPEMDAPALDRLVAQAENLDDNLARVQRHLRYVVAENHRLENALARDGAAT